jgi:hypothetical protein
VPDPDNKLGTIALSWMAASRVADLRASAAELAELGKEGPLHELFVSMLKLFCLLRRERDRSRRLLGLVAKGIIVP